MNTQVTHIRDAPAGWRNDSQYVDISRNSQWGNKYSHLAHSRATNQVRTRDEACDKDRLDKLESPSLLRQLPDLAGKILVCYCKPKSCHGDWLAVAADVAAFAVGLIGREKYEQNPREALQNHYSAYYYAATKRH